MAIERKEGKSNDNGPTSEAIALMKERLSKFETEVGRLKGLSYVPTNEDEVVISTTPKAGTTWMQQICHQIRSGGDMSFEEISEVVPYLELAYDQGQDLLAKQYGQDETPPLPRLFKTHAWEEHCPKFHKHIVVLRNPNDVVRSFYTFFEGWFFEPGTVDFESFAKEFWLARDVPESRMQNASYFVHLISWYKRRDDPKVLILFYEDLLEDLEGQTRRVARFMSTSEINFDSPEIIRNAVERSSFEYMKAHEYHFDEKLSKSSRNEACGLAKDAGMKDSKLRQSKLTIPPSIEEKIKAKWKKVVEPVTGCATYEELRDKLSSTINTPALSRHVE